MPLDPITRFDGALFFNQSETLEWQLNIENLSDRHYYSTAHNDNNITIGTPRTVLLSANLSF